MAGEDILVVDDTLACVHLNSTLKAEGYHVTCVASGEKALELLGERIFDLVFLEIMLPGIDGFEVCRRIREISVVPIIILTSRDAREDIVRGLFLGADHYVTKPFCEQELLARVEAVLRRARWTETPLQKTTSKIGDLHIDSLHWRVTLRDQEVNLSRKEHLLLSCLTASQGTVLTREYLLEKAWGPSHEGEYELLRVAMWRLRQKLERDPSSPRYIITRPGVGYMLAESN